MKQRFNKSILISLALHIALALILLNLDKQKQLESSRPIEITLIPEELLEQNKLPEQQLQIVDQNEKSVNDDLSDKAKFLSRHNQKVLEETRAANHGRFNNNAGQGEAPKSVTQQQVAGSETPEKNKTPQKAKTKSEPVAPWEVADQKTKSGLPTLEALKPKFDWNKMANKGQSATSNDPRSPSATDDYLKDVKTGAQTMLNTREFVYFTYYNRIKNQLQQYWEPKIKGKVQKLFQQGRNIASDQDRVTKLRITLNEKGTLVGVAVLTNSGVQDLDEAAIEAFKAAAPFPNPPKGIVDADGTIKIDWSFILEARETQALEFQFAKDQAPPRF